MNLFNNILIKIDLFSDKFLQENVLFSPKFCSKMCTKLTTVVSQKSPDFEKKSCFFADFPVTINFSFFKVSCYAGGILPPETPPKLNSASPRYVPKSFPHFGEQVPLVRLRFGDAGGIPPGAPLYTGLRP